MKCDIYGLKLLKILNLDLTTERFYNIAKDMMQKRILDIQMEEEEAFVSLPPQDLSLTLVEICNE